MWLKKILNGLDQKSVECLANQNLKKTTLELTAMFNSECKSISSHVAMRTD